MFRKIISSASRARQHLREETIRRGGLFFSLFWGVLCFGGLTLIFDVCRDVIFAHRSLASFRTARIVAEDLIVGLMWGAGMWWWVRTDPRRATKEGGSNRQDSPQ